MRTLNKNRRKPVDKVVSNCLECGCEYSILGFMESKGKEVYYDCSMFNCRKVKVA